MLVRHGVHEGEIQGALWQWVRQHHAANMTYLSPAVDISLPARIGGSFLRASGAVVSTARCIPLPAAIREKNRMPGVPEAVAGLLISHC